MIHWTLVMLSILTATNALIRLQHINTIKLPITYDPDIENPVYEYGADVAETAAVNVDPNYMYAYVAGNQVIHVVDIMKPGHMELYDFQKIAESGGFNDAEVCDSWLAVSFDSKQNPAEGKVFIYKTNARGTIPALELRQTLTVDNKPEMVLWADGCKRLIVAVEGEVIWADTPENIIDPEGEIVIYDFSSTPEDTPTITRLDFTKFNAREEEYIAKGVRRVYKGEGMTQSNTFSQDLEPEYLAINEEESLLYVTLQEANAVAVVDLTTLDVSEIYPMGEVDWSQQKLDPSDRDNMISIKSWQVSGSRQPDGIAEVTLDGISYLVTANEGDAKENGDWTEEQRGRAFVENDEIASYIDDSLKSDLADDAKLGRLKLSKVDGKDENGKYTKFVAFGSRGFSVFRASDMKLMWDSESGLEEAIATYIPYFFNANSINNFTPNQTVDTRSDDKGAEPESIAIGQVNGKMVVFIGLERPGIVAVYTMESYNGEPSLTFQSIMGPGSFSNTWGKMWEAGLVRQLDPEDIRFIPVQESDSIYQTPILAVSGSYSGTFSMYEVIDDGYEPNVESDAKGLPGTALNLLILLGTLTVHSIL